MRSKIVLITWLDSNFEHGWLSIDQVSGVLISTYSVGFVVVEEKEKISIAQNRSEINTFMGVMTIPKSCISSIKEMRVR